MIVFSKSTNSILTFLDFLCCFIVVQPCIQSCGHILMHWIRIKLSGINSHQLIFTNCFVFRLRVWFATVFLVRTIFASYYHSRRRVNFCNQLMRAEKYLIDLIVSSQVLTCLSSQVCSILFILTKFSHFLLGFKGRSDTFHWIGFSWNVCYEQMWVSDRRKGFLAQKILLQNWIFYQKADRLIF